MTWTGQAIGIDSPYFTIAELRRTCEELRSETLFTDDMLEQKRAEAEEDFEALAHRAFVPRAHVCHSRGGSEYLFLPFRDIRAVTRIRINGSDVSFAGVTIDPILGALRHPSRWPDGVLEVSFEHGKDTPPAGVKRAVLLLAKIYALPSAIDPRATAMITSEIGGYRISVADSSGKSGIPDVDAAAARYGDNTPVVA